MARMGALAADALAADADKAVLVGDAFAALLADEEVLAIVNRRRLDAGSLDSLDGLGLGRRRRLLGGLGGSGGIAPQHGEDVLLHLGPLTLAAIEEGEVGSLADDVVGNADEAASLATELGDGLGDDFGRSLEDVGVSGERLGDLLERPGGIDVGEFGGVGFADEGGEGGLAHGGFPCFSFTVLFYHGSLELSIGYFHFFTAMARMAAAIVRAIQETSARKREVIAVAFMTVAILPQSVEIVNRKKRFSTENF